MNFKPGDLVKYVVNKQVHTCVFDFDGVENEKVYLEEVLSHKVFSNVDVNNIAELTKKEKEDIQSKIDEQEKSVFNADNILVWINDVFEIVTAKLHLDKIENMTKLEYEHFEWEIQKRTYDRWSDSLERNLVIDKRVKDFEFDEYNEQGIKQDIETKLIFSIKKFFNNETVSKNIDSSLSKNEIKNKSKRPSSNRKNDLQKAKNYVETYLKFYSNPINKEKKLTVEAIAGLTDYSKSTWSDWLNGPEKRIHRGLIVLDAQKRLDAKYIKREETNDMLSDIITYFSGNRDNNLSPSAHS